MFKAYMDFWVNLVNKITYSNYSVEKLIENKEEKTLEICGTINQNTVEKMAKFFGAVESREPITIFINSPGGEFFSTTHIVNKILTHKGRVTCITEYAKSGGTLIAIACDRIITTASGEFGPCDIVCPWWDTILFIDRTEELKNVNNYYRQILFKAICQKHKLEDEQVERMWVELASGKYSHSKNISPEFLKNLGLKVIVK